MADELKSWTRPHFERSDAEAFLFYVAFGDIRQGVPLSSSKYRSKGPPDGFDFQMLNRARDGAYMAGFQQGYLWEQLRRETPDLARQVVESPACLLLQGAIPDPPDLNYLRDAVGLLTYSLDIGARCIFDPQAFTWWSPDNWRERIFDPAGPVPRHHVTILISEEEAADHFWFHTRGLRKFARPDVSVRGVHRRWQDPILEMINRFIEHMAFGLVVPEGQVIRMSGLPPGGRARHGGELDDPDFNNRHLEIFWPDGALDDD